jgi:peptide/nickel transport system substrate-binding protein
MRGVMEMKLTIGLARRPARAAALLLMVLLAVSLAACQPLPAGTGSASGTGAASVGGATTAPSGTTSSSGTPVSGGVLHYGLTLPVSGIDPHIHANSELGIALSSVYDTLVVQDKDGKFYPSLAEKWEVSPDGKTYTFTLRKDVNFHDGTPFNAAAVVANLTRITDPATKSQKAVFLLGPYAGSDAVDDYTVRMRLKEPFAPLLDGLSQVYLGMASPAALKQWGDQYQLHQVGTGPFKFVSYQQGQSLVLERNPDYNWAPSIRGHQGPAYLDRIEFRFYADQATRLPALLAGQADVMGELPTTDAQQLTSGANAERFKLRPVAVPGESVQFFMNTQLAPLDDVKVRQALLYLTDRASLVKAIFGQWSPVATGPLAAVTKSALGPTLTTPLYPYDPAKGKVLLQEAGWTDSNGDGVLDKDGKKLELKGVLMTWGELPAIGTILQSQWKAAGVQLDPEQMPYPAALDAGSKGTVHLDPFSNSGTDPSSLRTFFHGDNIGAFNWSRVNDPEVNAWLDQAQATSNADERTQLYLKVQQHVMDQAWTLPMRDQVNLNAAATRVQGLTYDVQGWFPVLYDVSLSK